MILEKPKGAISPNNSSRAPQGQPAEMPKQAKTSFFANFWPFSAIFPQFSGNFSTNINHKF